MSKSFFCAFFVVLPDYDETAKSSNMNKESQLHSEHAHNDDKKRLNKNIIKQLTISNLINVKITKN